MKSGQRGAPDATAATLFLCGDVMPGRGIDQILRHPSKPELHEPYVRSAQRYVELAERTSGPIPRSVEPGYIWGDALAELERLRPAARVVNLETAITASDDAWPGKGINYRMHPANVDCLSSARVDCCALANNHVLDWGHAGLADTLATLRAAGIRTAGAGANEEEAWTPAVVDVGARRRVLVFACGTGSAGVPREWAAAEDRAGVAYVSDLGASTVDAIAARVGAVKHRGDLAVLSIHWGANWGYDVPDAQRSFARRLVEHGVVDIVHGHSSHHPKGFEIHRERLILYGCGDFLNDYEGIGGYERFRGELGLMYFPALAADGALVAMTLVPTRIRRFRVELARGDDAAWLAAMLEREGLGTRVVRRDDDTLLVEPR